MITQSHVVFAKFLIYFWQYQMPNMCNLKVYAKTNTFLIYLKNFSDRSHIRYKKKQWKQQTTEQITDYDAFPDFSLV